MVKQGNDYRLIVAIAYKVSLVYIKFIGTTRSTTPWMPKQWT